MVKPSYSTYLENLDSPNLPSRVVIQRFKKMVAVVEEFDESHGQQNLRFVIQT
jgi:hypothetical protein